MWMLYEFPCRKGKQVGFSTQRLRIEWDLCPLCIHLLDSLELGLGLDII